MKYLICDVENITTTGQEAPNGLYYPNGDKTKHARFQFPSFGGTTMSKDYRFYASNDSGVDGMFKTIFETSDDSAILGGYTEITEQEAIDFKVQWKAEKASQSEIL